MTRCGAKTKPEPSIRREQERASPATLTVDPAARSHRRRGRHAGVGRRDRDRALLRQVAEDLREPGRVEQVAERGEDLVGRARHDPVDGGQHLRVAGLLRRTAAASRCATSTLPSSHTATRTATVPTTAPPTESTRRAGRQVIRLRRNAPSQPASAWPPTASTHDAGEGDQRPGGARSAAPTGRAASATARTARQRRSPAKDTTDTTNPCRSPARAKATTRTTTTTSTTFTPRPPSPRLAARTDRGVGRARTTRRGSHGRSHPPIASTRSSRPPVKPQTSMPRTSNAGPDVAAAGAAPAPGWPGRSARPAAPGARPRPPRARPRGPGWARATSPAPGSPRSRWAGSHSCGSSANTSTPDGSRPVSSAASRRAAATGPRVVGVDRPARERRLARRGSACRPPARSAAGRARRRTGSARPTRGRPASGGRKCEICSGVIAPADSASVRSQSGRSLGGGHRRHAEVAPHQVGQLRLVGQRRVQPVRHEAVGAHEQRQRQPDVAQRAPWSRRSGRSPSCTSPRPRRRSRDAAAGRSDTSTPRNRTRPPAWTAAPPSRGISSRHGSHQEAQTLTTVGRPRRPASRTAEGPAPGSRQSRVTSGRPAADRGSDGVRLGARLENGRPGRGGWRRFRRAEAPVRRGRRAGQRTGGVAAAGRTGRGPATRPAPAATRAVPVRARRPGPAGGHGTSFTSAAATSASVGPSPYDGHSRATGQAPQAGLRAWQRRRPWKITRWRQHASTPPAGTARRPRPRP